MRYEEESNKTLWEANKHTHAILQNRDKYEKSGEQESKEIDEEKDRPIDGNSTNNAVANNRLQLNKEMYESQSPTTRSVYSIVKPSCTLSDCVVESCL